MPGRVRSMEGSVGNRAVSITTGFEERSIGFKEAPSASFGVQRPSAIWVVANVVGQTRADNQIGAGLARLIGNVVCVGHSRGPAGRVTRTQGMRPIVLCDGDFAREHVEELVFFLVPMSIRGACTRHELLDERTELCKATRVGRTLSFRRAKRIAGLTLGF